MAEKRQGISPGLLEDVSASLSRIQELSLGGGFPFPAELSVSLARLQASLVDQPTSETSISFDSQLYSDAEEREEARQIKRKRNQELRQLKEESSKLRASVHSRLSDFRSERSLRPSFVTPLDTHTDAKETIEEEDLQMPHCQCLIL